MAQRIYPRVSFDWTAAGRLMDKLLDRGHEIEIKALVFDHWPTWSIMIDQRCNFSGKTLQEALSIAVGELSKEPRSSVEVPK